MIFDYLKFHYPICYYKDVLYNAYMEILKENYIEKAEKYPKNYKPSSIPLENLLSKYNIKLDDINKIKGLDNFGVENAIIYQQNKYTFIKGVDKNRVSINKVDILNSKIIHSHPMGSSFSKADIDDILLYGGDELIAFNDNYFYFFKNNLKSYNSIYDTIATIIDETTKSLNLKIERGELSKSEFDFIIPHLVWQKVSKLEEGFIYESYAISK